ncbi:MAG: hypothetical protein LBJ41_05985 [Treponema sp.]|nr:hypothetical protein [Treponema sp.]
MITSDLLFSFVWQWTDSFHPRLFLTSDKVLSGRLGRLADRLSEWLALPYGTGATVPVGYTQMIIITGLLRYLVPVILLYLFA